MATVSITGMKDAITRKASAVMTDTKAASVNAERKKEEKEKGVVIPKREKESASAAERRERKNAGIRRKRKLPGINETGISAEILKKAVKTLPAEEYCGIITNGLLRTRRFFAQLCSL